MSRAEGLVCHGTRSGTIVRGVKLIKAVYLEESKARRALPRLHGSDSAVSINE